MTRETAPITAVTIDKYTVPDDLAGYEELMQHEASEGLLDRALLAEVTEHLDYCAETPDGKLFLTLRRWQHSPETAPRDEVGKIPFGLKVESAREMTVDPDNLPSDTSRLISRVYELTGASVIRDDTKDGKADGVVIRGGTYKGTEVYFRETYGKLLDDDSIYFHPDAPEQRSLGIEVMGENRGRIAFEEISTSQLSTLETLIGEGKAKQYVDPHRPGEWDRMPLVNRRNFTEILDLLSEVSNHAFLSAAEQKPKRPSFPRIRKLLGSLGTAQSVQSRPL